MEFRGVCGNIHDRKGGGERQISRGTNKKSERKPNKQGRKRKSERNPDEERKKLKARRNPTEQGEEKKIQMRVDKSM